MMLFLDELTIIFSYKELLDCGFIIFNILICMNCFLFL